MDRDEVLAKKIVDLNGDFIDEIAVIVRQARREGAEERKRLYPCECLDLEDIHTVVLCGFHKRIGDQRFREGELSMRERAAELVSGRTFDKVLAHDWAEKVRAIEPEAKP